MGGAWATGRPEFSFMVVFWILVTVFLAEAQSIEFELPQCESGTVCEVDPTVAINGTKGACTSACYCPWAETSTATSCIRPATIFDVACVADANEVMNCDCTDRVTGLTMQCHESISCQQLGGVHSCECGSGFTGDDFVAGNGGVVGTCVDVDECESDPCGENSRCKNTNGGFECTCRVGFIGDGYTCEGTSDCGDIEHASGAPHCHCDGGYTGVLRWDFDAGKYTGKCAEVNECDNDPTLCGNYGACVNTPGSFACQCITGYYFDGDTCRSCGENVKVNFGGYCTQCSDSFTCTAGTCQKGYTFQAGDCRDVNECELSPCHPNATCTNVARGFRCVCNAGYTGDGVSECKNQNECGADGICSPFATCEDTAGSFSCSCIEGFHGDGFNCLSCLETVNLTNAGKCYACDDARTCTDAICPSGFAFEHGDCKDVDECLESPCGIHATCINTNGSYACKCDKGYRGDGYACEKFGECETFTPCHKNAACADLKPTGHVCTCNIGYQGNGYNCTDVDECLGAPCSPDASCVNVDGSYECVCNKGFVGNGKSCQSCAEAAFIGNGGTCSDCVAPAGTNVPHIVCIEGLCPAGYSFSDARCKIVDACTIKNTCDVNARCTSINTDISCECKTGFVGDGRACVPASSNVTGSLAISVRQEDQVSMGMSMDALRYAIATLLDAKLDDVVVVPSKAAYLKTTLLASRASSSAGGATMLETSVDFVAKVEALAAADALSMIGDAFTDGTALRLARAVDLSISECSVAKQPVIVDSDCVGSWSACDESCGTEFTVTVPRQGVGRPCEAASGDLSTCPPGKDSCPDTNECASENACDEHATCTDTFGSYACTCNSGWVGDGFFCSQVPCPHGKVSAGYDSCNCSKGYFGGGLAIREGSASISYEACAASSVFGGDSVGEGNGQGLVGSDKAWCASHGNDGSFSDQWWQMDVGDDILVAGVEVQGRKDKPDLNQYVSKVTVSVSLNGQTFGPVDAGRVFDAAEGGGDALSKVYFKEPVFARFVRVHVAEVGRASPKPWACMRTGVILAPQHRRCDPCSSIHTLSSGGACTACDAWACTAGTCPRGHTFDVQEGDCVERDECSDASSPCDPHATCANTDGSYTCTCDVGYDGDGLTCEPCASVGLAFNGTCLECDGKKWRNETACTAGECPPGHEFDGDDCARIVCPGDARLCPDGETIVYRDSINACAFQDCPEWSASPSPTPSASYIPPSIVPSYMAPSYSMTPTVGAEICRHTGCVKEGDCDVAERTCLRESDLAFVRCCYFDDSWSPIGWTTNGLSNEACSGLWTISRLEGRCHPKMTWPEANALCTRNFARLCTITEVEDGCVKNAGCGLNPFRVWTSDFGTYASQSQTPSASQTPTPSPSMANCVPFQDAGERYVGYVTDNPAGRTMADVGNVVCAKGHAGLPTVSCLGEDFVLTGCHPCSAEKQQTYADLEDLLECKTCTSCPVEHGEHVRTACTDVSDAVCECDQGFSGFPGGSCVACTPGRFQDRSGQPSCNQCPRGHFSNETHATSCEKCSPGTFQDSLGKTGCKLCPAGKYNPHDAGTFCVPCGYMMIPNDRQDGCIPASTTSTASISISPSPSQSPQPSPIVCDHGTVFGDPWHVETLSCVCHVGYFGGGRVDETEYGTVAEVPNCQSCSIVELYEGGTCEECHDVSRCTRGRCPPGYTFDTTTGNCLDVDECKGTPCSEFATCSNTKGSYQCECNPGYQGDGYSCGLLECHDGEYRVDGVFCTECPAGYHRNQVDGAGTVPAACDECPSGSWAASGTAFECSQCPAGKYRNRVFDASNESAACQECPDLYYQDLPGQTDCKLMTLSASWSSSSSASMTSSPTASITASPSASTTPPTLYMLSSRTEILFNAPPTIQELEIVRQRAAKTYGIAYNETAMVLVGRIPSPSEPAVVASGAKKHRHRVNLAESAVLDPGAADTQDTLGDTDGQYKAVLIASGVGEDKTQPNTEQLSSTINSDLQSAGYNDITVKLNEPDVVVVTDIKEGDEPSCANGTVSMQTYVCTCDIGFVGGGPMHSDKNFDPCLECAGLVTLDFGGVCHECMGDPQGHVDCTAGKCPAGFTYSKTNCIDVDECVAKPCHPRAACQNSAGSYDCLCDPGLFGDGFNCNECAIGKFQGHAGMAHCVDCEAGKVAGSTGQASCDDCATGTYQPLTGAEKCLECPPGNFTSHTSSIACAPCPPGYHQAFAGTSSCKPCAIGTFQGSFGTVTCRSCAPGTFQASEAGLGCDECPVNTFQANAGEGMCEPCADGYFTEGRIGQTECVLVSTTPSLSSSMTASPTVSPSLSSTSSISISPSLSSTATSSMSASPSVSATPSPLVCDHGTAVDDRDGLRCECDDGYFGGGLYVIDHGRDSQNDFWYECSTGSTYATYNYNTLTDEQRAHALAQWGEINGKDPTYFACVQGCSGHCIQKGTGTMAAAMGSGFPTCKSCAVEVTLKYGGTCERCGNAESCAIGKCPKGYSFVSGDCSDVNECAADESPCDEHATCTNTAGSYTCVCDTGHVGDGYQCKACGRGKFHNRRGGSNIDPDSACENDYDIGIVELPSFWSSDSTCDSEKALCTSEPAMREHCQRTCGTCGGADPTSGAGATGSCDACPVGTYANEEAQASCSPCEAGSFANTTGNAVCEACVPGTHAERRGQTGCDACPSGQFGEEAALVTCSHCPAGMYGNVAGKTRQTAACRLCKAGTYSDSSARETCTACQPGHFNDADGGTFCSVCDLGHFAAESASTKCDACSAGMFQNYQGAEICQKCPAGRSQALEGSGACDSCPAGQFQSAMGSAACVDCPIGYFQANMGKNACEPCAEAHFTPEEGATECIPVSPSPTPTASITPSSSTTPSLTASQSYVHCGGTVIDETCVCGEGYLGGGSKQIDAETGMPFYAPCRPCSEFITLAHRGICTECSDEFTCTEGQCPHGFSFSAYDCQDNDECELGHDTCHDQASCHNTPGGFTCACNAGYVGDGHDCQACEAGKHQPRTGQSACLPCPQGSFATRPASATCPGKCLAGQYGDVEGGSSHDAACKICPAGRFTSVEGSAVCSECPEGKYQPTSGSKACVECPTGHYGTGTGQDLKNAACLPCGRGTYGAKTGATECALCPVGSYADAVGMDLPCKDCPAGHFAAAEGATGCAPCEFGKYNPKTRQSECRRCEWADADGFTGGQGDATCIKPSASPSTTTSLTPSAVVTPSPSASVSFIPCDNGQQSVGMTSCTCNPGFAGGGEVQGVGLDRFFAPCESCEDVSLSNDGRCKLCTDMRKCVEGVCPAGFTFEDGDCVDKDECEGNPCSEFASCSNTVGGFTCICKPGYAGDGHTCDPCERGTYSNLTGAALCTDCPPGAYANKNGMSRCIECLAGEYNPRSGVADRREACSKCASGTFSPAAGSASCTPCPAGEYSEGEGNTACLPCAKGLFNPVSGRSGSGAEACDACEAGKFNAEVGAARCEQCKKGHYQDDRGSVACKPCSAGKFADLWGLGDCKPCASGTYAAGLSSGRCAPCAAGMFQRDDGKAACVPCGVGKFQERQGQSSCVSCPIDYHQSNPGQQSCEPCPDGMIAPDEGATACVKASSTPSATRTPSSSISISPSATPSPVFECDNGVVDLDTESCACNEGFLGGGSWQVVQPLMDSCFTESGCRAKAEKLGLEAGGVGYNFAGAYKTKGCYTYTDGKYKGHAYFGIGGTDSDMKLGVDAPKLRVQCEADKAKKGVYGREYGFPSCDPCGKLVKLKLDHPDVVCTRCNDDLECLLGECPSGYSFEGGQCVDVDECNFSGGRSVCHPHATCSNSVGGFQCTCNPGYFGDGEDSCQECSEGSYQDQQGQDQCKPSTMGHAVRITGAKTAAMCEPGTFQDSTGQADCKKCPAGTFGDEYGKSLKSLGCKLCPAGKASVEEGVIECIDCAAGMFTAIDGAHTSCEECPPGHFEANEGSTGCTPCTAGTYQAKPGQQECLPCIEGSFSDKDGSVNCVPCGIGTHGPSGGLSTCVECAAGTYTDAVGLRECSPCAEGTSGEEIRDDKNNFWYTCTTGSSYATYNANTLTEAQKAFAAAKWEGRNPAYFACVQGCAGDCIKEGAGVMASIAAAKQASPVRARDPENDFWYVCTAGSSYATYNSETLTREQQAFALGKWGDSAKDPAYFACVQGCSGDCVKKGEGVMAKVASKPRNSYCDACAPGKYSDAMGMATCTPCPVGMYESERGSVQCKGCPAGTHGTTQGADEASDCTACRPGLFGDEPGLAECKLCRAGTFVASDGSTDCEKCSLGQFSAGLGASMCSPCEPGYHQDLLGSDACTMCVPGMFQDAQAGRVCKTCHVGTYQDESGGVACKDCPNGKHTYARGQSQCEGASCDHGVVSDDMGQCGCNMGYAGGGAWSGESFPVCAACRENVALSFGGTCTSCTDFSTCLTGTCPSGYSFANGDCVDVDECIDDPCPDESTCFNTQGGHGCMCGAGYFPLVNGAPPGTDVELPVRVPGQQLQCMPCPQGQFGSSAGVSACEHCPPGSTTVATGETECVVNSPSPSVSPSPSASPSSSVPLPACHGGSISGVDGNGQLTGEEVSCACNGGYFGGGAWGPTSRQAETSTDESCFTEGGCRARAEQLGIEAGGVGYAFSGEYGTKGCYTYASGKYKGHAYFGTGGSKAEMEQDVSAPKLRVECNADNARTTSESQASSYNYPLCASCAESVSLHNGGICNACENRYACTEGECPKGFTFTVGGAASEPMLANDGIRVATLARVRHEKVRVDNLERGDEIDESLKPCKGGHKDCGYEGQQFITPKGNKCQAWDCWKSPEGCVHGGGSLNSIKSNWQKHVDDFGVGSHNFCRNPDGSDTIWCYTTNPQVRWEYCKPNPRDESLKPCKGGHKDCGYEGQQFITPKGNTCQAWDCWKSPEGCVHGGGSLNSIKSNWQKHVDDFGVGSHNFCRNPDGSDTIWCYTTNPQVRWEYCKPKAGVDRSENPVGFPSAGYSDAPVVIMGALTFNGGQPAQLALASSPTSSSAEVYVAEPPCHDGSHAWETAPWLAVEPGRYITDSNAVEYEVGRTQLTGETSRVNFFKKFDVDDIVVLASLQHKAKSGYATLRVTGVDKTGFSLFVEDLGDSFTNAVVGYFAIPAGEGTIWGRKYVSKVTARELTHDWKRYALGAGLCRQPRVFASISRHGGHHSTVRIKFAGDGAFDVRVQESNEYCNGKRDVEPHPNAEVVYMFAMSSCDDGNVANVRFGVAEELDHGVQDVAIATENNRYGFPVGGYRTMPVVIGGVSTYHGHQPTQVTLADAPTATSAKVFLAEPDCLDGWHKKEFVPWFAAPAGRYKTDQGVEFEVGRAFLSGAQTRVGFNGKFGADSIVVIMMLQRRPSTGFATLRLQSVDKTGFTMTLENADHSNQVVGYLAIPAGEGSIWERKYVARVTPRELSHEWKKYALPTEFCAHPKVFGSISANGEDESNLRLRFSDDGIVEERVQESHDFCNGKDVEAHTTETVHIFALSGCEDGSGTRAAAKAGDCGDVDECKTASDNCHALATCSNSRGTFGCECTPGSEGDGFVCALCAVGKARGPRQAACEPCPEGQYADEQGLRQCKPRLPCNEGWYRGPSSLPGRAKLWSDGVDPGTCLKCAAGTFKSTGVANSLWSTGCTPCPMGTYTDQEASQQCKPCSFCEPGWYRGRCEGPSAGTCLKCAAGKYKSARGAWNTVCTDVDKVDFANKGVYQDEEGQTTAKVCPRATYYAGTGSRICFACGSGKYGDVEGALNIASGCKECPAGQYQDRGISDGGSTECKACAIGTYQNKPGGTTCLNCNPGRCSTGKLEGCGGASEGVCVMPSRWVVKGRSTVESTKEIGLAEENSDTFAGSAITVRCCSSDGKHNTRYRWTHDATCRANGYETNGIGAANSADLKAACPNHANAGWDCGWPGISKEHCEARGCCHDPTSPKNWCYPSSTFTLGNSEPCSGKVTYSKAVQICAQRGGRLCTKDEAMSDCTAYSGCGYDAWYFWTSTSADAKDCKLSPWGEWSACQRGLQRMGSFGTKTRTRRVLQPPVGGGLKCKGDLTETVECQIEADKADGHWVALGRSNARDDMPRVVPDQATSVRTRTRGVRGIGVRCCNNRLTENKGLDWGHKFRQTMVDQCFRGAHAHVQGNTEPCKRDVTWSQARDECKARGARLCTLAEIQADCTAGTGCGYDAEYVWTSTGAGSVGMRVAVRGRNDGAGEVKDVQQVCVPETTTIAGQQNLNGATRGFGGSRVMAVRCCSTRKIGKSLSSGFKWTAEFKVTPRGVSTKWNRHQNCKYLPQHESDNWALLGNSFDYTSYSKYIGCYRDDGSVHDLHSERHVQNGGYTLGQCANMCRGYKFYGLQDGAKVCSCGNQYGRYGRLPDTACGGPGTRFDPPESRGGLNDVEDALAGSMPEMYSYLGCYRDKGARDLAVKKGNRGGNIKTCAQMCSGYQYFGLQYYGECWCGNKYGSHGKLKDTDCGGAANEHVESSNILGGPARHGVAWKQAVYHTLETRANAQAVYRVPVKVTCDVKKTYEEAQAICDARGGRLCTKEEVMDDCTTHTGCGFDHALVWTSSTCRSDEQVKIRYLGCYKDADDRDLEVHMGNGKNVYMCSQLCSGWNYFAIQNRGECWCGNEFGAHGMVRDAECGGAETNDAPSTIVGGIGRHGRAWRNAVYRVEDAATGFYWIHLTALRYMGCYRDTGNRDLHKKRGKIIGRGTSTESCRLACKDYAYFALQDGDWCMCGDAFGKYGKRNDGECHRTCHGENALKPDRKCGGPWRNSIYKDVSPFPTHNFMEQTVEWRTDGWERRTRMDDVDYWEVDLLQPHEISMLEVAVRDGVYSARNSKSLAIEFDVEVDGVKCAKSVYNAPHEAHIQVACVTSGRKIRIQQVPMWPNSEQRSSAAIIVTWARIFAKPGGKVVSTPRDIFNPVGAAPLDLNNIMKDVHMSNDGYPNGWSVTKYRAVDGVENSRWVGSHCTHSVRPMHHTWWDIEFKSQQIVSAVGILRRGDCCNGRDHDQFIQVLDGGTWKMCNDFEAGTAGEFQIIPCEMGHFSRVTRVRIATRMNDWFSICDVKVYGGAGYRLRPFDIGQKHVGQTNDGYGGTNRAHQAIRPAYATKGSSWSGGNSRCTHSRNTEQNAAWYVDLGHHVNVAAVTVINRHDCCAHRLRNIDIELTLAHTGATSLCKQRAHVFGGSGAIRRKRTFACRHGYQRASRVTLRQKERDWFTICGFSLLYLDDRELSSNWVPVRPLNLLGRHTPTMSGSCCGGHASRSINGYNWPVWNHGQCSHLGGGLNQWWQIDLGKDYKIAGVKVLNRVNCCWNRHHNYNVKVGGHYCGMRTATQAGVSGLTRCEQPIQGRLVRIEDRTGLGNMQLCDVEIYVERDGANGYEYGMLLQMRGESNFSTVADRSVVLPNSTWLRSAARDPYFIPEDGFGVEIDGSIGDEVVDDDHAVELESSDVSESREPWEDDLESPIHDDDVAGDIMDEDASAEVASLSEAEMDLIALPPTTEADLELACANMSNEEDYAASIAKAMDENPENFNSTNDASSSEGVGTDNDEEFISSEVDEAVTEHASLFDDILPPPDYYAETIDEDIDDGEAVVDQGPFVDEDAFTGINDEVSGEDGASGTSVLGDTPRGSGMADSHAGDGSRNGDVMEESFDDGRDENKVASRDGGGSVGPIDL